MKQFKTILMTAAAALLLPSAALAQVPTEAVKEKAVDTVIDNMTSEDAVVAGKTMIKGGSKEDAAIAIVKNRADKKIESMTGGTSVEEYSKEGVMDAGKEMAEDKMKAKAKGSSTTYSMDKKDAAKGSATTYTDEAKAKMMEEAKAKSIEKAKTYGETYGMSDDEKAKRLITSGAPHVIQKSGTPAGTTIAAPAPTVTAAPLNCPAGTKDAGDGTCMITGDWKP